ncbi:hypothetical protein Bca52824_077566 [Brassica carinata]|uniref:Reverse transcriptase zinc-binding domain-containing protein n=1 Tax=Brassica carinata TaxID=52824 RepID=A0A8X7TXR1_BRACI|nr:hypothetical protein Bca52824_077566 [Brassica carinata]
MNPKHGHGIKIFANGDVYDGEWRRGLQEAQGNRILCNETEETCQHLFFNCRYSRQVWKIRRVLGFPSGNGTFKWESWDDGSFYVGHWSKDPEEMNCTYYPSGNEGTLEWDTKRAERVPVLPSQKMLSVWNSSKRVEKPRRISVDGRVSVGLDRAFEKMNMCGSESGEGTADIDSTTRRDLDAAIMRLEAEGLIQSLRPSPVPMTLPKAGRKQGETISKDLRNY